MTYLYYNYLKRMANINKVNDLTKIDLHIEALDKIFNYLIDLTSNGSRVNLYWLFENWEIILYKALDYNLYTGVKSEQTHLFKLFLDALEIKIHFK